MISAIVLAAGEGTRFGQCKQLALLDGKPLLERTLDNLRASRITDVVVVLGAHAAQISSAIAFPRERVVVNAEYGQGISTSIRAGLSMVDGEAAMIVLGDQPFVRSDTLDALCDAYGRG